VGFLPVTDERMAATIQAVQDDLVVDGFVRRYRTESAPDGLASQEGTFLLCSFWLVDCLVLQGRMERARMLFDRLCDLRNDLGLLSEEYEPSRGRMVGNFPQAFSHIALATAATTIERAGRWAGVQRGATEPDLGPGPRARSGYHPTP
jgi:GH15 family glucan-1,4-alpha-glucosidase